MNGNRGVNNLMTWNNEQARQSGPVHGALRLLDRRTADHQSRDLEDLGQPLRRTAGGAWRLLRVPHDWVAWVAAGGAVEGTG